MSVQQQIFPRASVEVGYYRRTFTQFTTGGTVTDNLDDRRRATSRAFYVTAPIDPRLPGGGGYQVGPFYNLTPAAFSRVPNNLFKSTKDVGDDTRVFNGVDVTFNVRVGEGLHVLGRHQHRQGRQRLVRDPRGGSGEHAVRREHPREPLLPPGVAVPDGVSRSRRPTSSRAST